ncbi:hypothetical protein N9K90_03095 [Gammaproteobacteria bacterium]|nr:hypothetical protein [Gammaproteobacteria bacterium]
MKSFIVLIIFASLASCSSDTNDSNFDLSNFIKPEYTFKKSSLRCALVSGETLNSVERFIPKLVNSFKQTGDSSDELYFLFPVIEDEIETQTFELLLKHADETSLEKFSLTLDALSFDNIADCNVFSVSSRSLRITNQMINLSPVIAEILECEYRDNYSYATMKLVIEQFNDALIKNNLIIDILYSENENSKGNFQWTNIFSSLESRVDFVELWQELEISKEIQELLLEQSACKSSRVYRQYQVL